MKMRVPLLLALAISMSACLMDHKANNAATEFPADTDVVVFGEIHGTKESLQIFKNYVEKMASANGDRVVVGLEVPPDALNDAKEIGGRCAEAKSCAKLLLDSPFWAKSKDGRSSEASFHLITDLSKLERSGEIVLAGIDTRVTGREAFGDLVARELQPLIGSSKTVLLTGNGHAHFDSTGNSVPVALQNLKKRVAVVLFQANGGTAWVCSGGQCGVQPLRPQECVSNFDKIGLNPGAEVKVCVGNLTASAPMVDVIKEAKP